MNFKKVYAPNSGFIKINLSQHYRIKIQSADDGKSNVMFLERLIYMYNICKLIVHQLKRNMVHVSIKDTDSQS